MPTGAGFQQGRFDPCLGPAFGPIAFPRAGQSRRDHLGVIQHQPIAGAQPVQNIRHPRIGDLIPVSHQQPRRRPRLGGPRGDQFLGQVEIEIGQFHWLSFGGVSLGAGRRNISLNMPGVKSESGLTDTRGLSELPRMVKLNPISPSPLRVSTDPIAFTA